MERSLSTFDQLVKSLSTEETQSLLESIQRGMEEFSTEAQQEEKETLSERIREHQSIGISSEPFLIRLWLSIKSFLRSIPLKVIYNEELLKRMAKSLKRTAGPYININQNVYSGIFYTELKNLRKTQLFFTSLLSAYDSGKGSFYMLVSSFVAPATYERLMKETNPFSIKIGSEVSSNIRTGFLRKIDSVFSNLTDEEKSEMYQCAQAIEWMKSFCSLALDKTLLRFNVISDSNATCQALTIQPEMEVLSSILYSKKNIPHNLLQALFLMHAQETIIDDDKRMVREADEFIKEAIEALGTIRIFLKQVPLLDITRYIKKDINWMPYRLTGGEDWFIYFKQAWYERFNQKWSTWSYEQKKFNIKVQMINLLKVGDLESMKFCPWRNLWVECKFKKELPFLFLKTFFYSFYNEKQSDTLKTILVEGNFYRHENLNEYTTSYNVLEHRKGEFEKFENRLSPTGDIGTAFAKIRAEKTATLKNKNQIEGLMHTIESEAKQLINSSIDALKSVEQILTGILGGGKTSLYATITNWAVIAGANNGIFREEVASVKEQIHTGINLLSLAEKLEAEAR
ncbi:MULTISPECIES: DUF5312 domain-containing protein [unclassified Treponema]|uniref:DUF5312 domain-containing protein n=1 Tax=unclassified Treponema TaxID=2638727 RepID=UPI0020A50853|nr:MULTISPECIES: DUF5312 domain-containing protein [unclassified Treponema]UTC67101.1 DUF5312 domain-containing protein [Treponema sp. OMZ 789]UTC69832.1 DUF5312 domain-containing protein [Treponema sp. OMZ 790]UTC72546.1 DUF5312 domain-containing protein [Treponema sp. OMZ 791]